MNDLCLGYVFCLSFHDMLEEIFKSVTNQWTISLCVFKEVTTIEVHLGLLPMASGCQSMPASLRIIVGLKQNSYIFVLSAVNTTLTCNHL